MSAVRLVPVLVCCALLCSSLMSPGLFLGPRAASASYNVTLLTSVAAQTTGDSLSISLASSVPAGQTMVIALVLDGAGGPVSCSDSRSPSNIYVVDADVAPSAPDATVVRVVVCSAVLTVGLETGDAITAAHPVVTARAMQVIVVDRPVARVAAAGFATSHGGGDTMPDSGPAPVNVDDLVIGAIGVEGSNGYDCTPRFGFQFLGKIGTSLGVETDNTALFGSYREATGTGSLRASCNLAPDARDWAAVVVVYHEVTGLPPSDPDGYPHAHGNAQPDSHPDPHGLPNVNQHPVRISHGNRHGHSRPVDNHHCYAHRNHDPFSHGYFDTHGSPHCFPSRDAIVNFNPVTDRDAHPSNRRHRSAISFFQPSRQQYREPNPQQLGNPIPYPDPGAIQHRHGHAFPECHAMGNLNRHSHAIADAYLGRYGDEHGAAHLYPIAQQHPNCPHPPILASDPPE